MTEEHGVGLCQTHAEAINWQSFLAFLKKLRSRHRGKPITLFMDQLSVHKATALREWWPRLDIEYIFNVSYSPEFNPIEAVFSKVKAHFARNRLNCLVNRIGFNTDNAIEAAFSSITAAHCGACVRKSYFLLQRAA